MIVDNNFNNNYGLFMYAICLEDNEKKNLIYLTENTYKNYLCYFKIKDVEKKNFINNELSIPMSKFPWINYLKINSDLEKLQLKTYNNAWYHWVRFGMKEERAFSYINNSNIHHGRLGNIFFLNMFLNFISKKYDLKCNYKHYKIFRQLGIKYHQGNNIYDENVLVTDKNFLHILKSETLKPCNVILNNNLWFQNKEFCKMIYLYFKNKEVRERIIKTNLFKFKYKKNNDLFIHIRCGDIKHLNNSEELLIKYKSKIDEINFENGFLASDTINDKLCQTLISMYNLKPIEYNEVHTIMFGSTCNNIILSGGTFSWMIGFFAFFSKNISYIDLQNKWYGDIFNNKKWHKI